MNHRLWKMNKQARRKEVDSWGTDILEADREELVLKMRRLDQVVSEIDTLKRLDDSRVLEGAQIIGCTTWGAANYSHLLRTSNVGVVIVEEAGEVLEAHILTALPATCKQLILIGDHKQLRPKVEHYPLSKASNKGYDLDVSLFERLALSGRVKLAVLNEQHRMRPTISQLVRTMTYPALQDHASVRGREHIKGLSQDVVFVNIDGSENGSRQVKGDKTGDKTGAEVRSKSNDAEADMVAKTVVYLLQQGYAPSEIVVLTPYLGQLVLLREKVGAALQSLESHGQRANVALDSRDVAQALRDGNALDPKFGHVNASDGWTAIKAATPSSSKVPEAVLVATVDNFQGEEARIIVASLVRRSDEGRIGFLKEAERVNVLLSRARDGLILFGHAETFHHAKLKQLWGELLAAMPTLPGLPLVCSRHHTECYPSSGKELERMSPNGGCGLECQQYLSCNHKCPLKCHPREEIHNSFKCKIVVSWQCEEGGHTHTKPCYQDNPKQCENCVKLKKAEEKVKEAKLRLAAVKSATEVELEKAKREHEARKLQQNADSFKDKSQFREMLAALDNEFEVKREKLAKDARQRQRRLEVLMKENETKHRKALEADRLQTEKHEEELCRKMVSLSMEREHEKQKRRAELQQEKLDCLKCQNRCFAILTAKCPKHTVCDSCITSTARVAVEDPNSSAATELANGKIRCPVPHCANRWDLGDVARRLDPVVCKKAFKSIPPSSIGRRPDEWGHMPELLHDVNNLAEMKMVEDFINQQAAPRMHGVGRDSHGKKFCRFIVTKVQLVRNRKVWARYDAERRLHRDEATRDPFCIDPEVNRLAPEATRLPLSRGMPQLQRGERLLFHGSAACNVICQTGFEVKYSFQGAAAYGRGIYLAPCPSKSDQYARGNPLQMLICRAQLGRAGLVTTSRSGEPLLPEIPGRDGERFDAIVVNGNSVEVVLGQNNLVYPEVLVTYTRA